MKITKEQVTSKTHYSGSAFSIALVLMIAGWAIEVQDEYPEYNGIGTIMFTIGFWLFMIPLIIISVILVIFVIAYVMAS